MSELCKVAVIPNAKWLSRFNTNPSAALKAIKERTGACDVEFHKVGYPCSCGTNCKAYPNRGEAHVVLTEPMVALNTIQAVLADKSKKASTWCWFGYSITI